MAAHSIWTGSINFGLVTIPVKLMTAVREHTLHFHFLHGKDQGRVQNTRTCSVCGEKVPWNEVQRGFEVSKGKFVVLTDEDFKRVDVEATQSVDICEFVDESEIDPMLYDRPYYLEPEKKGRHAYGLLRDTLTEAKKVGVAKVVIREKEHLAVVRAEGAALVLELLHFADEVVNSKTLELPPLKRDKASAGEKKAAKMLVEAMAATFDPAQFHDKYAEELKAMIAARARGAAPAPAKKAEKRPSNVVDLVSVLQRSLAATSKHRGGDKAPAATPARKSPAKRAQSKRKSA
jgi:DNA end-binding protein Ku